MQTVMIEGYLAADPAVRAAQGDGRRRAVFRVGETTRFRRADGSSAARTTWFDCVCFNEAMADNYIAAYARKGSRVVIQGHVEENRWTGRDGVEHYDQTMVVETIRISGRRREAGIAADAAAAMPSAGNLTGEGADETPVSSESFREDAIPF